MAIYNPDPWDVGSTQPPFRPARPRPAMDLALRGFMLRVFNTMAGGLALTGLVAYAAAASGLYAAIAGTPLLWVVVLAPVGLALLLGFGIERMSPGAAQVAFWSYAALMGLSLASIFLVYTGASIARVFFISAGAFAATAAWGYTTRTDLSRFGSFLFMGLVGIVLASVVNIFLASSAVQFAVSVIGVLVFTGLTAYDTQRLKEMHANTWDGDARGRVAILGALMLYLDFINLFISLLQLFGTRRD
ncbi:MAG TPA: Bax inhibitor-1/YccA family protein [Acetobacteraceae bacterium]|jgi:FtsH-binding integral membrane protein|nr:Bax inhibitor-1/YccA family protein [Acetobacteraceae bacterium]